MRLRFPLFSSWQPHHLGSSLPIGGRLRAWALGFALVGLALTLLVLWALGEIGQPGVEAVKPAYVQKVVEERLARVELPVWSPGEALEPVEAPGFAPPPPPPPATEPHPGDPPLGSPSRLHRALTELEGRDPLGAATELAELADSRPRSWLLTYDSGLGFLIAGFTDRAVDAFSAAEERLEGYSQWLGSESEHHAALIVTRYAAAHALREVDCIASIERSKGAVRRLRPFTGSGGAKTFDRRLPYAIRPHDLSSLDIFQGLVESYRRCEDRYPADYFADNPGAATFRDAEYDDPADPDVRKGPFGEELAACIASDGAEAWCWALSNLNAVYVANLPLLGEQRLAPAYEPFRDSLARLAYDVALTVAKGPQPESAPDILLQARRLAPEDRELQQRIQRLALHLAAEQQDYTVLAESFRGRNLESLLTPTTPAADLKGIAWAMRDRWLNELRNGRPSEVFRRVSEVRQNVPAPYLDSLDQWEGESREALREALADEIRVQKRRGNLAVAAGLRDYRAPWLGEEWPQRAESAWWTPGLRVMQWGLWLLLALVLGILVLVYRYAVYPYVLHTAILYRPEFDRRVAERGDRPFTGPDLYEQERRRRKELP